MWSYHRQLVRDHSYKALALGSIPASKDDGTVYPSGRSYAMFCQSGLLIGNINMPEEPLGLTDL